MSVVAGDQRKSALDENLLDLRQIAHLRPTALRPDYDPGAVQIGIVHLGTGAFHRAHQAAFIDALLARDPRWGICGISLKSPAVRDALAAQDGLYTIAVLDEAISFRVVGALRELLVAPENPERVLARMAASTTRLVSLTITEKGYCLSGDGSLDLQHPDIVRDLASPAAPCSAIGYLVEALKRRRTAGAGPFTVISCDNLVDNGQRLGRAVRKLAAEHDVDLAQWIEMEVSFPRTMVDSIVPATDDMLRSRVSAALGVTDRWPVQREAFAQWVIEDRFCNERPDFESVGVTIANDVEAYAASKLRLLNGAHSTLAYLGTLSGCRTVGEAMRDPALAGFVQRMMLEDIRPSIVPPRGLDLGDYCASVLARFRNPSMHHALQQIAWDGSQKLPVRLLGTITDNLAAQRPIQRLCLALAAWMHLVRGKALLGERVVDPLAENLFKIARKCVGVAAHDVPKFLQLDTMFPDALRSDSRFLEDLAAAYARLGMPERSPLDLRGAIRALC